MKVTTVLSTAILILLPGTVAPAFAQEHEREKEPEQKQQQAKPAIRQQQAKPDSKAQQAQHQQPAKPKQQQVKHAASRQRTRPAGQIQRAKRQQAKPAIRQQQASRGSEPAADHGRIPEDRFRASFGRAHTFHVNRSDFANGSGRFQYGGFWFNAVAPWPAGWLYTDNVYVDYLNGGYFLCNPAHPGVYVSINIG